MHLSDMTGLQLAAMLRDDPRFSGIGFVLMSSETDNTEASIVVAGPRRVLLVKPFDLKQLAQAIATATGRTTETLSAHA